jgi:hypothetical protein
VRINAPRLRVTNRRTASAQARMSAAHRRGVLIKGANATPRFKSLSLPPA